MGAMEHSGPGTIARKLRRSRFPDGGPVDLTRKDVAEFDPSVSEQDAALVLYELTGFMTEIVHEHESSRDAYGLDRIIGVLDAVGD